MPPRDRRAVAAAAAGLALGLGGLSAAWAAGQDWTARKCDLYTAAVVDALEMSGRAGLRAAFLRQNDDFIASGCVTPGRVCARTQEEIALADLLTLMTMNEGMASTFVPFGCDER